MADLSTEYLGLKLANPLVPSASPLSRDLGTAKRLEDAGAAAIVMYSLFEEKIMHEQLHAERFFLQQGLGHAEADSFHPTMTGRMKSYQEEYLEQLQRLKQSLDIPVIASLNGTSPGGWIDYAIEMQQAGADALELNVYHIAAHPDESGNDVEQRYIGLLAALKRHVHIPVAMKLSPQFSAPIHFARQLEAAGANGLVLFNRFYQPDIDLDTLQVNPRLELSTSAEALLRIRWIALMHGKVNLSLAVTGGFHTAEDLVKALLAGADVTHVCSVLLSRGPEYLEELLKGMTQWLEQHEYQSVRQMKGSVSQRHAIDPAAYERTNYMSVLDGYSSPAGVLR